MNSKTFVSEVHEVSLTIYRDTTPLANGPATEWIDDNCFKLTFDSPYLAPGWTPFSDAPGQKPVCEVRNLSHI